MRLRLLPYVAVSAFILCDCEMAGLYAVEGMTAVPSRVAVDNQNVPGADLFIPGTVVPLRIELEPDALQSLREKPRRFVSATVREGTNIYTNVGVHLKGSVGTFRPVDEKPDLTLDFSRFRQNGSFHGLRRIHLNNALEDPSCLNEHLGSELFLKAGIPTPRVGYTLLALNSRNLGLFVLKEGFTENFLRLHFKTISGDLYEPGTGTDADTQLKRNSVMAPFVGNPILKPLEEVVSLTDSRQRWERFNQSIDVDRLATFMALEVILGHRDGYCLARNNFRVYFDADERKLMFLPHGMDQLLGTPEASIEPAMSGAVAKAFMDVPEGRALYKARLGQLVTNLFVPDLWLPQIDGWVTGLRPHLSRDEFTAVSNEAQEVKKRFIQRRQFLLKELSTPARALFVAFGEPGKLNDWRVVDRAPNDLADQSRGPKQEPLLHFHITGESSVSWRTQVLLGRGQYRFEGRAKWDGLKPLPYGRHQGVALRVVGRERNTNMNDLNAAEWKTVACEFTVDSIQEEVELVCEVRSSAGDVWFDRDSLRISQIR